VRLSGIVTAVVADGMGLGWVGTIDMSELLLNENGIVSKITWCGCWRGER